MAVDAFLAHENIEVSNQWRTELLKQLKIAQIFVALISANYFKSPWCVQESGIAAFRKLTIIPLSIDGTIPQGFISDFQSIKIDPANPSLSALLPGLANHDVVATIDKLIEMFGKSIGYRLAEDNFELLRPFLDRASNKQKTRILTVAAHNEQIYDAGGIHQVLPPIVKTHGQFMQPLDLAKLKQQFSKYNIVI
jgi:hypothetical protein